MAAAPSPVSRSRSCSSRSAGPPLVEAPAGHAPSRAESPTGRAAAALSRDPRGCIVVGHVYSRSSISILLATAFLSGCGEGAASAPDAGADMATAAPDLGDLGDLAAACGTPVACAAAWEA